MKAPRVFLSLMVLFGISHQAMAGHVLRYKVQVKKLKAQPVLSERIPVKQSELGISLGKILPDVFNFMQSKGIPASGAPFARYHGFKEDSVDLEAGLPVYQATAGEGKVLSSELPGGSVAITLHEGPYESLPLAYQAIQAWATSHGHKLVTEPWGAPWEVYVSDPEVLSNPEDWKTEVYWPVRLKSPGLRPASFRK